MTTPDLDAIRARAEHTITYWHDRDTATAVLNCHAAPDADCRLTADCECESWVIDHDEGGPFHMVTEWDEAAKASVEVRHPMKPADYCNVVEYIDNGWDVSESGPDSEFVVATIPVDVEWDGHGYTWSPAVQDGAA